MDGQRTVLVVDDDIRMLTVCREILVKAGYRVLLAREGEEGTRAFRIDHNTISVVVLDWILPGLRGEELVDRLLEIDPQANIVLFTGYSYLVDEPTGRRLEPRLRGFLKKPFHASELVAAIDKAIGGEKDELVGQDHMGSAETISRRRSGFRLPGLFEFLLLLGIVLFAIAVIIIAGR